MAYKYRGDRTLDAAVVEEPARPVRAPFDPAKCGTYAGYRQHHNHDAAPCRPCKDAAAAYQRELKVRRAAGLVVRKFESDKCGTLAGYSRHVRLNVPLCDECKQARAEYRAGYYERTAA